MALLHTLFLARKERGLTTVGCVPTTMSHGMRSLSDTGKVISKTKIVTRSNPRRCVCGTYSTDSCGSLGQLPT